MKSSLKYSITGSVIATLLIVVVSMQYENFEAEAIVGEGMPEEGIIQERQMMGISGGYTGYGFQDRLYVVHITSGNPDIQQERHSSMMGIQHAKAFQDAGKNVIVFLDVEGVRIADVDHHSFLSIHHETLKEFVNDGGRVIVCEHCVASFEVDNLLRGVEIDPHPFMPKLQRILTQADIVLDY